MTQKLASVRITCRLCFFGAVIIYGVCGSSFVGSKLFYNVLTCQLYSVRTGFFGDSSTCCCFGLFLVMRCPKNLFCFIRCGEEDPRN